jgi:hypothetical protein
MNLENMQTLKAFFDDGAPHFHLDMTLPLGDPKSLAIQTYADEPIPADCGSAGCIAGAAYMLLDPFHSLDLGLESQWDIIGPKALKLLGLPEEDEFYQHPLFSSELAPEGCTAEQASQAIQNVIDGKEPWL